MEQNDKLVLFQEKQVRRIWHDEQWYFSVVDVIGVLTNSPIPRNYWNILKKREPQLHTVCMQLKLMSGDGKNYKTDCANTEGVLRIVMSIPSPKAEPFKLWLAQVGKEHLEEIENPELAIERIRELYKAKGYTEEWIDNRLKSISIRKELTDEWKKRGIIEQKDYSFLTATIAKHTFGLTPSQHKEHKSIKPTDSLRDNMTTIELLFSAIGEEATRMIAVKDDAQGYAENHDAAVKGGMGANSAIKNFEKNTGLKVVSKDNFLEQVNEAEKGRQLSEPKKTKKTKKRGEDKA
jgi:DNA-damage-inducible protein D